MRYYNITISPPTANPSQFTPFSFSSQTNGIDNYSCLQVDLDIYQTSFDQYSSNGYVRLMGVDLKQLNSSANINPQITADGSKINLCKIKVEVGMSKGLPYANPKQRGVVLQGGILQAFGNWQGTTVSLDMVLAPIAVDQNAQNNITFSLKKGQELTDAVKLALQNSYKNADGTPANVVGSFSQGLKYTEDAPAQHFNLFSLASAVKRISKQINPNPAYTGATITATNTGFYLTDSGITPSATKVIEFTDVIGNLTWLGINTISAKVVMRGDLNVGDYISFQSSIPISNIINNQSQYRNKIAFNNVFYVTKLHHVGSSRNFDGNSWVTVIEAIIPGIPLGQTT
jgi:hypothetical protein